jgi:hypothetical protein
VAVDSLVDQKIMKHFVEELERRMREDGKSMSAAELELVRKFLSDTGVTLDSIKAGRFGKRIKEIADEKFGEMDGGVRKGHLPFDEPLH